MDNFNNGDFSTRTVFERRQIARASTIKAFRRFLDALDTELACYNHSSVENEFTAICFRYLRKAVRALRDDPKNSQQITVFTVLDLVTAWDEWTERQTGQQRMSRPMSTLHATLSSCTKQALKAWRLYWIQLQLPPDANDNGSAGNAAVAASTPSDGG